MPNRIIRESICTSKTLAQISAEAERLWWRLIVQADDHGCYYGEPDIILGQCLSPFLREVSEDDVRKWLGELENAGLVELYEAEGRTWLHIKTWSKHQRPPRSKPKYPLPPENNCGQMPSNDANRQQMTANDALNRNTEYENKSSDTGSQLTTNDAQLTPNVVSPQPSPQPTATGTGTPGGDPAPGPGPRSLLEAELRAELLERGSEEERAIHHAFFEATGRLMTADTDLPVLHQLLREGITPEQIVRGIRLGTERARRSGKKPVSMGYFVGPIREVAERDRRPLGYSLPDPDDPVLQERQRRKALFEGGGAS